MIMSKTMLGRFEARARRALQDEFGKNKYRLRGLRETDDGRFSFDLEHLGLRGVTFTEMEAVSRLFDTKGINVSSVYTEGCPTCGGEKIGRAHV